MNAKVKSAINFMVAIANNSAHGYDQIYRWGEHGDYDCSSLVITAFEQAGIPLKTNGATYTGNMKNVALKTGFKNVTNSVNLVTGHGIKAGDILLNEAHHVALAVTDGGSTIVHASINENGRAKGGKPGDQTGREICTRSYYNKPWNVILRYAADGDGAEKATTEAYTATGTANVGDFLNVRSVPSTAGAVVGAFAPGDVIYITGKCSNGWYRCKIWDDSEAFVCGDYVKNVKQTAAPDDTVTTYTATGTANVGDFLNVRSAPSIAAGIVAKFAPGDVICITGKCSNGWYRCKIWDGSEAFVCGDYVKIS